MKKLLMIAATLLMLAVSGCAPQVDVEADAAAVRSVFDEATAALNPGGGDIVDLDTEDVVVMYASEPAAIGKEAIRAREQIFDDQATFEESRSVEEVVASGDWAFVRWTGTGTVTPKDGGESSEFNRKGITIFQRQPDKSWKIARVIWNSNLPLVAPKRKRGDQTMAKSFMQMAEEAMAQVDGINPNEVQQRLKQDSNALLVDVRDAADIPSTGLATGGLNISLGMLPVRADLELPEEWRDAGLQDRSRQIITTCQLGPNGSIAAKLLKDMGFTNVSYMAGGVEAWKAADLPTE